MDETEIALINSEIKAHLKIIADVYTKIEERAAHDNEPSRLESLGYQLHNLYCAFEDLFKTVAGFFENSIDDMTRYHSELLRRMTMDIEGIRPALIDNDSYRLLDNLRAFRHFFRHAYLYEIEPRKVKIVLDDALKLKNRYPEQIESFIEKIKQ